VRAYNAEETVNADGSKYATVEDGRIGLAFIEAAVASSAQDGKWTVLD
jgi:hypothetical protein